MQWVQPKFGLAAFALGVDVRRFRAVKHDDEKSKSFNMGIRRHMVSDFVWIKKIGQAVSSRAHFSLRGVMYME